MNYNIPMIDFSKCGLLVPVDGVKEDDLKQSGNELYSALSTTGFAYLTNHGIEWRLVDEMNAVAEKFYSRPAEFKMMFEVPGFALSYDSIGRTKFDGKRVDNNEGFRAGGEGYTDTNHWPTLELKECYTRFANISAKLVLRLLKALAHGTELKDREYFCKAHSLMNQNGNYSITKTIKYPPINEVDAASENRIGVHSDKSTMTLLFQDDAGGLQVIKDSGNPVDVPPVPGAIVLNVGDTLESWSGGRLRATTHIATRMCRGRDSLQFWKSAKNKKKHRVNEPNDLKNRGRIRRSVIFFAQANEAALMKKLVYEDNPDDSNSDKEKALSVKDYMAQIYNNYVIS